MKLIVSIFIFLFSFTTFAQLDSALIAFFDKNYSSAVKPNCNIDSMTKTRIMAEMEPRCFRRARAATGESFIAGFKSDCSQGAAYYLISNQINSICDPQLKKIEAANEERKKQIEANQVREQFIQQAQQQQQQAQQAQPEGPSKKQLLKDTARLAKDIYKDYRKSKKEEEKAEQAQLDPIPKIPSSKIFGEAQGKATNDAIAAANAAMADKKNTGQIALIPSVPSASIFGESTGSAVNRAIQDANRKIEAENLRRLQEDNKQLEKLVEERKAQKAAASNSPVKFEQQTVVNGNSVETTKTVRVPVGYKGEIKTGDKQMDELAEYQRRKSSDPTYAKSQQAKDDFKRISTQNIPSVQSNGVFGDQMGKSVNGAIASANQKSVTEQLNDYTKRKREDPVYAKSQQAKDDFKRISTQNIPSVQSNGVFGDQMGKSVNGAIDSANQKGPTTKQVATGSENPFDTKDDDAYIKQRDAKKAGTATASTSSDKPATTATAPTQAAAKTNPAAPSPPPMTQEEADKAERMQTVKDEYKRGCVDKTVMISDESCGKRKATIENYDKEIATKEKEREAAARAPAATEAKPESSSSNASNSGLKSNESIRVDPETGSQTKIIRNEDGSITKITKYEGGGGSVEKVGPDGIIQEQEQALPGEDQSKLDAKAKALGVESPNEMKKVEVAKPEDKPIKSEDEVKGEIDKNKKEVADAAENSPEKLKEKAKGATDDKAEDKPDDKQLAREKEGEQKDKTFIEEFERLKKQVANAKTESPKEANQKCTENDNARDPNTQQTPDPKLDKECQQQTSIQKAISCVDDNLAKISAAMEKLPAQKNACTKNSAQAEKLCSFVRSDKIQKIQEVMSIGGAILTSVTAASESCGTTANLAKVAQGGMLLAQFSCTAVKVRCDFSCASAEKLMQEMRDGAKAIQECELDKLQATKQTGQEVANTAKSMKEKLETELSTGNPVPDAIVQCEKHKADILGMMTQVAAFAKTSADAKKCKEQLTSGGGSTSQGQAAQITMTTAEYCANPSNAQSPACKCTADPNAEGCLGGLAQQGLALARVNAQGGANGFAGPGASGGGGGLTPADNFSSSGGGGGKASSGTVAGGSGAFSSGGVFNSAAAAAGGAGGAGLFGAADGADGLNGDGSTMSEENKRKFGFFSNAAGLFGGGSYKKAAPAISAAKKQELEQVAKRKIAAEQLRSEVSAVSGETNFEKIRNRYKSNYSSFIKD